MLAGCGDGAGPPVRVIIPAGVGFRAVADSLERAGLVSLPRAFGLYAKARRLDRRVKSGTYILRRGSSWNRILDALAIGRGMVRSVTIPEGWSISQIVPQLSRALNLPVDSLEAAVRDTALRRELDVPTATVEGYLFPETYLFPVGTSARAAIRRMVDEFEKRWTPEWDDRARALAMSRNDIMALAAIIEKEARIPEERPVISAVYHNRLKKGMLLQADPTVQYALGRHVARVLYRDLEIDSRYNTYRYKGLPPGPIASPGAPSIDAALHPADVPYLYFVAHPDGHHEFRTTFSEHVKAVALMKAAARALTRRAASDSAARGLRPGAAPTGPRTRR
ncbi:MAG: Endolytic murein transglycosylase [Gemmatimonadaceae bacterium]|nr:Endolytic murein transglycosylase [Gemmatimonadaceae bacterium]